MYIRFSVEQDDILKIVNYRKVSLVKRAIHDILNNQIPNLFKIPFETYTRHDIVAGSSTYEFVACFVYINSKM